MNAPDVFLRRKLSSVYGISLVVALGLAAASLAGLLFQERIYPTVELRQAFVVNDLVNLLVGLPALLGAMGLARKGHLLGLLLWPGALLYVVYNAAAYALAMAAYPLVLGANLALVMLSGYSIVLLLTSLDAAAVQQQLRGRVPERFAGGVLLGLGSLFCLRGAGQVIGFLTGQLALSRPELAVSLVDLLIMPLWVAGGVLLWRKQPPGYISGAGLLFQGSSLFVGLLVLFLLQPYLTGTPFPAVDFGVILGMGMICFIPCGLFVRGAV